MEVTRGWEVGELGDLLFTGTNLQPIDKNSWRSNIQHSAHKHQ